MNGVPHLKIHCIARHWFLMPDEDITYHASGYRYADADQVTR